MTFIYHSDVAKLNVHRNNKDNAGKSQQP